MIPNLDCMESDELLDTAVTFSELEKYARQKRRAVNYRRAGNIEEAIICEKRCDEIYTSLPEWARW